MERVVEREMKREETLPVSRQALLPREAPEKLHLGDGSFPRGEVVEYRRHVEMR
jgi:hypothetical protein